MYEEILFKLENNQLILPRLPALMVKINTIMEDDNKSLRDIADVIQYEASISARILQVANSPALRGRQEIPTIQTALTRLGINMIKNIILSMSFKDTFKANNKDLDNYLQDRWEHCIEIAIISSLFSESVPHLNKDITMMCGILHDIGVLPIIYYLDNEGSHLLDDKSQEESRQATNELVMRTHAEIGAIILDKWNFPDYIIEAVERHHNPRDVEEVSYADLIACAELCLMARESEDELIPTAGCTKRLGIAGENVEEFMSQIDETVNELKEYLLKT